MKKNAMLCFTLHPNTFSLFNAFLKTIEVTILERLQSNTLILNDFEKHDEERKSI